MALLFKKMTVCGVGLIGGSLAMIARKQKLIGRIVGYGRTKENLAIALQRGLIDSAASDPVQAADGADLLVLASPVMAMPALLTTMAPHLTRDAVVTDVGSVKSWVVHKLEPLLGPEMALVAVHPIAGKETTGAAAADPDLFRGRRVIISPSRRSRPEATEKIEKLWRATGARIDRIAAATHDRILALTSHLPQLAASSLAVTLADRLVDGLPAAEFGATGLRDTTRLAMSSAEMWRDICLTNRAAIIEALDFFQESVAEFKQMVEREDAAGLAAAFAKGRRMRERLK